MVIFLFLFSGVVYNALKATNLSPGTRETLERADFAFAPDPMLISATRLIRNFVYGNIGRWVWSGIFAPQETADEIKSWSLDEHVDRALSDGFLRTSVIKSLHNLFWDTLFIAIAHSYTEADRTKSKRSMEEENYFLDFADLLSNAVEF